MLTWSVQLDTLQPGWLAVRGQVPLNPAGPDADALPPDGAGCVAVGLGPRSRAVAEPAGARLDDGAPAGVGRRLPLAAALVPRPRPTGPAAAGSSGDRCPSRPPSSASTATLPATSSRTAAAT